MFCPQCNCWSCCTSSETDICGFFTFAQLSRLPLVKSVNMASGEQPCTKSESMIIRKWRDWAGGYWQRGCYFLRAPLGRTRLLVPTYHSLPVPGNFWYDICSMFILSCVWDQQCLQRNFAFDFEKHILVASAFEWQLNSFYKWCREIRQTQTFWESLASFGMARQDEYGGFGQSS